MATYNEILVGSMYWDRSLPFPVEAFFYGAGVPEEGIEAIRQEHRAFLSYYGLGAAEVPLLEFSCSQQSPPGNVHDVEHACWTDVSMASTGLP